MDVLFDHMRSNAQNEGSLIGRFERTGPACRCGFVWKNAGRQGKCHLIRGERRAYLIANVAVHPDFRCRGIAQSVAQAVEQVRRGCLAVSSGTEDNPAAISHIVHWGFMNRPVQPGTAGLNCHTRPPASLWAPERSCGKCSAGICRIMRIELASAFNLRPATRIMGVFTAF
jgi:hypothetical protein